MRRTQVEAARQALADLAVRPETSFALPDYLETARARDLVDVMNEIDGLSRIVACAVDGGKGSLSSRSS